MPYFSSLTR